MVENDYIIGKNPNIRQPTIIYHGNKIGDNFQTGHFVTIRENNIIGNNVSIGSHSNIEHHVIIEDNVRIHSNCFVPEYSILKKNCWLGPNVVLTNARYPRSINVKNELTGPIIMEHAKIGANSTILPHVKIGKYALIGAGAVVVKDVEDFSIIVGNPGKKIGDIRNLDKYEIDLKLILKI
ncbi:MAG: acyltransferase [Promethearchaeota archaeon]